MSGFIWHNGAFLPDGPVFTAHDRIRLGECVFGTILSIDGKLVHADLHLKKLEKNVEVFFGKVPLPTAGELNEAAHELLKRNNYTKGRHAVNIIVTRGASGAGIWPPENPGMQIIIRATPALVEFPPIRAIIAQTVRRNEGSPLSRIKCANYGENILALREAESKGANEAILLNNRGNISCATTSSLFAIIGGQLLTPPLSDGAQEGVTRKLIIEKFGAAEKILLPVDLAEAEGLYLVNSLRGAAPIVSLGGKPLPQPSLKIDKDFHVK